jgi:hypothetical protein
VVGIDVFEVFVGPQKSEKNDIGGGSGIRQIFGNFGVWTGIPKTWSETPKPESEFRVPEGVSKPGFVKKNAANFWGSHHHISIKKKEKEKGVI